MSTDEIRHALALYEAGDLDGAIWALGGPGPDTTAEAEEEHTERVAAAGWPAPAAVADWVAVAVRTMRQERGEPVSAISPVHLALQTALAIIEQTERLRRGLTAALGEDCTSGDA